MIVLDLLSRTSLQSQQLQEQPQFMQAQYGCARSGADVLVQQCLGERMQTAVWKWLQFLMHMVGSRHVRHCTYNAVKVKLLHSNTNAFATLHMAAWAGGVPSCTTSVLTQHYLV